MIDQDTLGNILITHFKISAMFFMLLVLVGGLSENRRIEQLGVLVLFASLFPNMLFMSYTGTIWLACAICPECNSN